MGTQQARRCEVCNRAPAAEVKFYAIVHVLIAWAVRFKKGTFCEMCALALFREHMSITLAGIWWGPGAVALPVYIILNRLALAKARRASAATPPTARASFVAGSEGVAAAAPPPHLAIPLFAGRPLWQRWTSYVFMVPVGAFILLAAYIAS